MIYISLGSNIENRLSYFHRAVHELKSRCLRHVEHSLIFETQAILPPNAPPSWNTPYLNMVVRGETDLAPEDLLTCLKQIERDLGRPAQYERWSPRVIDLDILMWDGVTYDTPHLHIPHAELNNRPFFIHLIRMLGGNVPNAAQTLESFSASFVLNPRLVGIVNATDDSFSGDGTLSDPTTTVQKAHQLAKDGASIIDIGAQSTRPGATLLSDDQEFARLEPVLDALLPAMKQGALKISLDSFRAPVIQKAIDRYPLSWINDVKGELDEKTLRLIAERNITYCAMHALTVPPSRDITLPPDSAPLASLTTWAEQKIHALTSLGFDLSQIVLDPGIGFGKTPYQNLAILQRVETLKSLGALILVGHSRKSFMQSFSTQSAADRDLETLGISTALASKVDFLRVHNVQAHTRILTAHEAVSTKLSR